MIKRLGLGLMIFFAVAATVTMAVAAKFGDSLSQDYSTPSPSTTPLPAPNAITSPGVGDMTTPAPLSTQPLPTAPLPSISPAPNPSFSNPSRIDISNPSLNPVNPALSSQNPAAKIPALPSPYDIKTPRISTTNFEDRYKAQMEFAEARKRRKKKGLLETLSEQIIEYGLWILLAIVLILVVYAVRKEPSRAAHPQPEKPIEEHKDIWKEF